MNYYKHGHKMLHKFACHLYGCKMLVQSNVPILLYVVHEQYDMNTSTRHICCMSYYTTLKWCVFKDFVKNVF